MLKNILLKLCKSFKRCRLSTRHELICICTRATNSVLNHRTSHQSISFFPFHSVHILRCVQIFISNRIFLGGLSCDNWTKKISASLVPWFGYLFVRSSLPRVQFAVFCKEKKMKNKSFARQLRRGISFSEVFRLDFRTNCLWKEY